jgi:hypothetical protein
VRCNLALIIVGLTSAGWLQAAQGQQIPGPVNEVLSRYCVDCHDADLHEGDVDLDITSVDWTQKQQRHFMQRVLEVNEQQVMPPIEEDQPTAQERQILKDWLSGKLLKHTPIGGTSPRRLSNAEYQTTIRALFNLPEFELPLGFPQDSTLHGFDNLGRGLVVSPALMQAYSGSALQVADELYPPKEALSESTVLIGPEDLALSYSAAAVKEGALRLACSSSNMQKGCTWPSRTEIHHSATYRITIDSSTFKPKSTEPMVLDVRALDRTVDGTMLWRTLRVLKEIEVTSESPQSITFEAELYKGQVLVLGWLNAELKLDGKVLAGLMRSSFERDKRFLAAWQAAVFPKGFDAAHRTAALRGRNGWEIVKRHLNDPELDLSAAQMDSKGTQKLLKLFGSKTGTSYYAEALCHYYFENGPALEIHKIKVEGPLKRVLSPKDKHRIQLQVEMAGVEKASLSDLAYAEKMLANFLPRAFRRPVDQRTLDSFLQIVREDWAKGHSFEEGMHLLIRNILISPRFLYRAVQPGPFDNYDLATRLSYFLTQGPPDETLIDLARRGRLSAVRPSKADPSKMEYWVLRREAKRLMPTSHSARMVESFTSQWLGTNRLDGIMPSAEFNFTPEEIGLAKSEVEWFFAEILNKNLPMTDFIDPDFMFTSKAFASENYNPRPTKGKPPTRYWREALKIERLPIERGSRHGGLLGQSAIMMATANGVDTQPVVRGVWVLENILGTPPLEPPKDVPALTPDTQSATTPRELLARHTADAACATCHRRIDPIGLMLENFGPVGNWRETWPKSGKAIDPSSVLPDGTQIDDVIDFKLWVVDHIDLFSNCLAQKQMTYATGRVLSHSEKHEIESIVKTNHLKGNRFKDLVLDLIESKTFQTK